MGTPPTGPEFVAARPGTADMEGVGAFITPMSPAPGANDEAVAILETELLRVGLPGLAGMNELGEAGNPAEGCLVMAGAVAVAVLGMLEVVGVGVGVEWLEAREAAVSIEGVCACRDSLANGPVYFSPNSPGANVKDEQNPSEEVINRVAPSFDLGPLVSFSESRVINLPRKVSKSSKVQITNYAQGLLLLGVINVHSILCGDGIHHAIR